MAFDTKDLKNMTVGSAFGNNCYLVKYSTKTFSKN